jgi:hypothetical protein
MLGEFGKQFHLDGAQERFGGPETQADLHDVIHSRFAHSIFQESQCSTGALLMATPASHG